MDMQNVSNLVISEGEVKAIHDKDGNLLWGRVAYDTKYAGDTFQQTYSGKNLLVGDYGTSTQQGIGHSWDNVYVTLSGTTSSTYSNLTNDINAVISAGTYTFSTDKVSQFRKYIRVRYNGANHDYYIGVGETSVSFTIPNDATDIVIRLFYIGNLTSGMQISETFGLMLESGSSASPFEPYTAGPAPNPDYPQPIQVVTGEQTISIADGTNTQNFTVNLGATEFCKIGTYQDYIYKSGDDWYVHKALSKYTFTGSETFNYQGTYKGFTISSSNLATYMPGIQTPLNGCSDHFIVETSTTTWTGEGKIGLSASGTFWAKSTAFGGTQQNCEAWLVANKPIVYYALATATDTKITDATLVGQLNAIHEWLNRYGYNATVTGNLPIIIDRTNL